MTKIRSKITYLKFHSNFPGANQLKTSKLNKVWTVYTCKHSSKPAWQPLRECVQNVQNFMATLASMVMLEHFVYHLWTTRGCFINVSRALQNILSKFVYCRNRTSCENFKLKLCTCATFKVLAWNSHYKCHFWCCVFCEIILESSQNIVKHPSGNNSSFFETSTVTRPINWSHHRDTEVGSPAWGGY